jgi:hypothetical protein
MLALAVDDIGEQERPALALLRGRRGIASAPADASRVLVDRTIHRDELAGLVERGDMIVQIGIGARRRLAFRAHVKSP